MADPYAHLSDADLEAIAAGKQPAAAPAAAAAPAKPDYSHLSDGDLEKIAGGTWERSTILPVETNSSKPGLAGIRPAVPGFLKNIADSAALPGDTAKGAVDLNSPEGWQRIVDFGTLFSPANRAIDPGRLVTQAGKTVPQRVTNALRRDRVDPTTIADKTAELGPAGVTADLGPNTRALTADIATSPGTGQSIVQDALTKRQAGAPARIRGTLDENLGVAPVPGDVHAGLKASQRGLGPEYEAALVNAKPVDTSALAAALDQAIPGLRGEAQGAVSKVRGMLNKTGGEAVADPAKIIAMENDPAKRLELVRKHLAGEPLTTPAPLDSDPRTLLATRQAIDGMINSTQDNNVKRVLGDARKSIDGTLAESVPGIKDADAKYANLAKTSEALDRGQTVLGSGRETPRPTELQAEVTKANAPTMEYGPSDQALALKAGARAEIERIVGNNVNDRAALNGLMKGEGDWNYARLSTLFGKDKTDAIYKMLENERTMAATENMATAGSKTGALLSAKQDGSPQPLPSSMHPLDMLRNLTAATVRGHIANRQAATNEDIANAVMSRGNLKQMPQNTQPPVPITAIVEALGRGSPPPKEPGLYQRRQFLDSQRVY